ncbi:MAG: hypothetical protein GY715_17210 [Planctomycetes bacterium]|nr:hypothetical protein [Planctomycetota bacterium]
MFKFLRKYNKWILAVGGTLLMIVFLIPQAIQQLSQRAAAESGVWATVGDDETEIPVQVRRQCENELGVLEQLRRVDPSMMITDQPAHWFLLVREAEEAGLVGGRAVDQVPPEQMSVYNAVAGNTQKVDDAISKRLAIRRLLLLYQNAAKLSDTRIRRHAQKQFHTVEARIVVLEASEEGDVTPPSESEIVAQFEEFRDVAPGAGDQETGTPGFGYRLPDRFKVEWLRIGTDSIRAMVENSGAMNSIALFKHWELNKDKGFPTVEDGAAVPEEVRTDLLDELTAAKRDEVERFAGDQFVAAWRKLRSEDGYRVLPDDWDTRRIDFRELASDLQETFPGLALPSYEAVGDRWLTLEEVDELEGLSGAATSAFGPRPVQVSTLIGAIKEFGGDPVIPIQQGITGPVLSVGENQDILFFRITETDPARPPHDLDEVRDQVVRDLKRKADFNRLLARKDSIEADARSRGLLTVAMEHEVEINPSTQVQLDNMNLLAFVLQQNVQITRTSSLPVIGSHVATVERIIERALELTANRTLAETPREERIFVVPVGDRMSLMLVELTTESPLTREQFSQLAGYGLQGLLLSDELTEIEPNVADTFSVETMTERHNFQVVRRVTEEDETEPDAVADAETE